MSPEEYKNILLYKFKFELYINSDLFSLGIIILKAFK